MQPLIQSLVCNKSCILGDSEAINNSTGRDSFSQSKAGKFHLSDLSDDVIKLVFLNCNLQSLGRSMNTCHFFKFLCSDEIVIWKPIAESLLPGSVRQLAKNNSLEFKKCLRDTIGPLTEKERNCLELLDNNAKSMHSCDLDFAENYRRASAALYNEVNNFDKLISNRITKNSNVFFFFQEVMSEVHFGFPNVIQRLYDKPRSVFQISNGSSCKGEMTGQEVADCLYEMLERTRILIGYDPEKNPRIYV